MHIHVGEGLNRGCKIAAELINLFQRLGTFSVSWKMFSSYYKYIILRMTMTYIYENTPSKNLFLKKAFIPFIDNNE